ncbi:MAG: hypothetical protein R3E52_00355 [Burkholderiaceae bacterium]
MRTPVDMNDVLTTVMPAGVPRHGGCNGSRATHRGWRARRF